MAMNEEALERNIRALAVTITEVRDAQRELEQENENLRTQVADLGQQVIQMRSQVGAAIMLANRGGATA